MKFVFSDYLNFKQGEGYTVVDEHAEIIVTERVKQIISNKECSDNKILVHLDLSLNKIYHLDADYFRCIPMMQIINLSHNQIQTVDLNSFQHNLKLTTIKLNDNKIVKLESNNRFNSGRFMRIIKKKKVINGSVTLRNSSRLGGNRMYKRYKLWTFKNLRCLRLDGNKIESGKFLLYTGAKGCANLQVNLQRNFEISRNFKYSIPEQISSYKSQQENVFTNMCECQSRFIYERFKLHIKSKKIVSRLVSIVKCIYTILHVEINFCKLHQEYCTIQYSTSIPPCLFTPGY